MFTFPRSIAGPLAALMVAGVLVVLGSCGSQDIGGIERSLSTPIVLVQADETRSTD